MYTIKANLPVRYELDEEHEAVQKFLALDDADKAIMLNTLTMEVLDVLMQVINNKSTWCRLVIDAPEMKPTTEGDNNE